ncbi:SprT family zinc-dependent metalloprotease [Verticiella sediminum]|uniref:M48 family metallopeptidase n=1 Tax=Verticiella sediminum TaxID=1247510 RepID=UPI0031E8DD26
MRPPEPQLALPWGEPGAEPPAPAAHAPASAAPAAGPVRAQPPATLPPQARWREVALEDQTIGFVLQRSRRRTIGFLITDDGLRVTAPRWVSLAEIDNAVRGKGRWILSRLAAWQERQRRVALHRTRWEDGARLPYLGVQIVFRTGGRARSYDGDIDAPRDGDVLWLGLPPDADAGRIRDAVQAWLQARARAVIGQRLEYFLQRTGLTINRWRLSSARTRWGSCTSQGNIMLNWRLVHFPAGVIDYVVAHELAHLREMNHGPGFWSELGQILPGYREHQQALRQHDPASLPSFN